MEFVLCLTFAWRTRGTEFVASDAERAVPDRVRRVVCSSAHGNIAVAVGVALCWIGSAGSAQLPPPPPPPATLWSFLGIPQAYRCFRDGLNAQRQSTGLERKPPLKAIADPGQPEVG